MKPGQELWSGLQFTLKSIALLSCIPMMNGPDANFNSAHNSNILCFKVQQPAFLPSDLPIAMEHTVASAVAYFWLTIGHSIIICKNITQKTPHFDTLYGHPDGVGTKARTKPLIQSIQLNRLDCHSLSIRWRLFQKSHFSPIPAPPPSSTPCHMHNWRTCRSSHRLVWVIPSM